MKLPFIATLKLDHLIIEGFEGNLIGQRRLSDSISSISFESTASFLSSSTPVFCFLVGECTSSNGSGWVFLLRLISRRRFAGSTRLERLADVDEGLAGEVANPALEIVSG